jgi:hypothetical protein
LGQVVAVLLAAYAPLQIAPNQGAAILQQLMGRALIALPRGFQPAVYLSRIIRCHARHFLSTSHQSAFSQVEYAHLPRFPA